MGSLDDLGNGCVPGVPGAGRHGDGEAIEVCGEGAGVPLEARPPDAALDLGRGPSRQGVRRRGLDRSEGLLGSRGGEPNSRSRAWSMRERSQEPTLRCRSVRRRWRR